jgi:hypothetical protein
MIGLPNICSQVCHTLIILRGNESVNDNGTIIMSRFDPPPNHDDHDW